MSRINSLKFLSPVLFALFFVCVPTLAKAQTFTVLYTFHGPDGAVPETQLTLDGAGNIYGTTGVGGAGTCEDGPFCGTVFAINKNGKLLGSYSFHGADGRGPMAGVYRDSAGNLWGTTAIGGNFSQICGGPNTGCGVVFRLTPKGKETAYKFSGPPGPDEPEALLAADAAGNLYGTSFLGGPDSNDGTAFKVDTKAGKGKLLYIFSAGSGPYSMIMLNGELYGTAGNYAYQMTTSGQVTIIGGVGGGSTEVLAADTAGNLYGTTANGGSGQYCAPYCGTLFKLLPNGFGGWTEKTLYVFCRLPGCADGAEPWFGPVAIDRAGNIYGTTIFGGTSQNCNGTCGVVYKVDPSGNETVIHNFTGGADGGIPFGGLTMDTAGNLYGTAGKGGDLSCPVGAPYGCGVVFKITP